MIQHRLERSIIRREGLIRRSLNQLKKVWSVRNANIPLKSEAHEFQFVGSSLTKIQSEQRDTVSDRTPFFYRLNHSTQYTS